MPSLAWCASCVQGNHCETVSLDSPRVPLPFGAQQAVYTKGVVMSSERASQAAVLPCGAAVFSSPGMHAGVSKNGGRDERVRCL